VEVALIRSRESNWIALRVQFRNSILPRTNLGTTKLTSSTLQTLSNLTQTLQTATRTDLTISRATNMKRKPISKTTEITG
jgi:hypothetical protein